MNADQASALFLLASALSTHPHDDARSLRRRRTSANRLHESTEIERLSGLPRYERTSTTLLDRPLQLADADSFLRQCPDIVLREIYRFESTSDTPLILDCGANVGLATLYWKRLYPSAQVTAFEPDPLLFKIMVSNCNEWNITGVSFVNGALWTDEGELPFWPEGSDAGRLLPDVAENGPTKIMVRTVRLRDYLERHINMLKLDVEGAELDILIDCADRLHHVEHLFVEYHSFVGQQQRLDELLWLLRWAEFRVYLQSQGSMETPFISRWNNMGIDQTTNVFAYREYRPPAID
jgi:FkbM family methyltransferase